MPAIATRRRLLQATGSVSAMSLLRSMPVSAISGTAVVTTAVLRVRSGPSTGYDIVGYVYEGDALTILDGPVTGFFQIQTSTLSGWVSGDYVDVTSGGPDDPGAGFGSATVSVALNLRTGPSTSYEVLTVMPGGAVVEVVSGPSGGWCQVTWQGQTGWASGYYLEFTPGANPEEPSGTGTATVRANLNLREGPGTNYTVLLVMPNLATVTVVSNPGSGWAQVSYQGTTGWASTQYLSFGAVSTGTATIGTDVLNLRSAGSLSAPILGQMLYGETVENVSRSGDWYAVTYHGTNGYAYGAYLSFGGPSASMWVPIHQQKHNLSCEFASCQIATAGLGNEIDEDLFIPVVGIDPNPHLGFRGNIDGVFIYGYEDYGVYPEPLVAALPQFGFNGRQLTGGKSELISELAAHHPVVVWIDLGYDSSFMYDIGGEMVLMATESHVVCAYGYNDEGVLISDPDSSRRKRVIPWDDFMQMWNSMDQYSLAITVA